MKMDSNHNIDTAKAYLEGMLWAAYGVRVFSDSVAEWQIDYVKECAQKLKEAEIDHSALTPNRERESKTLVETMAGFHNPRIQR